MDNEILDKKIQTSMDLVLTLVESQNKYFRDIQEFQEQIFNTRLHTTEITVFGILSITNLVFLLCFSVLEIPNVLFTLLVCTYIGQFIYTIFIINKRRKKLDKLYAQLKQLHSDLSVIK